MADNTEYEVQRVEGKRRRNGRVEYLLRWRGCWAMEKSWEPAENCKCDKLIAQFEANEEKAKEKKRALKRQHKE